ncbi:MAG: class I SAM-dependent methyltransferase [Candidatus Margulisiibacteriota bacterium]|nr:class I SAM-dependent methyltransferase [Candidatus Margulisiibacteriota bacterium]
MKSEEADELRKIMSSEYEVLPHLDSDIGTFRYIKDADKIKDQLKTGKILDWGCGLGQMSYLLKNRGFDVISYDIDQNGRKFLDRIGQTLILAEDPVKMPFPDGSFEAVLSSGVLEHVPDHLASIKEISRILKDNGYLIIFRLPNRYSYIEFVSDLLRRGDHPVKYSVSEIKQILDKEGFNLVDIRYKSFFPHNLKGFPGMVRKLYHKCDFILGKIDSLFENIPLINKLSTNIEIIARKRG